MKSTFKNPIEEKIIQEVYQSEIHRRLTFAFHLIEKHQKESSEQRKNGIPYKDRMLTNEAIKAGENFIIETKKLSKTFDTSKLSKGDWEYISSNSMESFLQLTL